MVDSKQLRQTAFISKIVDLKKGKYIKEDGWEPNYILTQKAKINRANLMGVIISKTDSPDSNTKNIVIDDGSGNINVRSFENTGILDAASVGDVITIIGRPREYGGEKYLLPEIIKKVTDKKWLIYRQKELDLFNLKNENINDETLGDSVESAAEELVQEEAIKKESDSDRIITFIKQNDSGDGVDIEQITQMINNPETEKIISLLLKQGEIFELKPGRVKVLE